MTPWQRKARLTIAVVGVVFAIVVTRELSRRRAGPGPAPAPAARIAPGVLVQSTGGKLERFKLSREDADIEYEKQVMYADGTSSLGGVRITTDERHGTRNFVIRSKEARVGQKESSIALDGDVQLAGSDGLTARTEHATYAENDGTVRAPGVVEFARARMRGTGVGMTYDKTNDVLTMLDQSVVHFAPDDRGAGAADVTAGATIFARRDKFVQFDRNVRIQRGGQLLEADAAVGHMSADEKRIESLELRSNARITTANPGVGALQALSGREINLRYAANGEVLEHAVITDNAVIRLAGEPGTPGRQITARTVDITLGPDGSTPTALTARDGVELSFPPEPGMAARTIQSAILDAKGDAKRGLTRAQFTGNVAYRERGGGVDRGATSALLDVGLTPGLSTIEDARFSGSVRFEDGSLYALAAAARYDLDKGTLLLTGSEPSAVVPHVINEQITIDAKTVDMTLAGPRVKATGDVRSQLQPPKKAGEKPGETANDVKMPSMLKQDQPVIIVANALDYDGEHAKGIYTGAARLVQGETTIKSESIVIDDRKGDLAAAGGVITTTVREHTSKDGAKEPPKDKRPEQRSSSVATSTDFQYDDAARRLTYTGEAHMTGPEGDMKADKIELYLKPSGDELDRAEAYDKLTLREQNRTTTGTRLTYTTEDEKYVVTGTPVTIVDECERQTTGKTLTFVKATDSIVVDGNQQVRTQTTGGSKCPGP